MEGTSWDTINTGQMLAYSSLVPPRVLFALDFFGSGEAINYWIEAYDTCNDALENLNNIDGGEKFEVGSWYFVAVVVGSPKESGGRSLFVMSGSQPGTQLTMKTNWCSHMPEGEEFIQALTVPGGMVMSPIEVTGAAMSVKELQNSYYSSKPLYRVRRGPESLDEERLNSVIDYETPIAGYPFPVSLVAPPMLLQTRRQRTAQCKYALGTEYNAKIWDTAVRVTCRPPYECSDDLTGKQTSLMACSADDAPTRFWDREPIQFEGTPQFYEFLQTVADAHFVARAGSAVETRGFLDPQTESISCLMITYSPQYGKCVFCCAVLFSEVSLLADNSVIVKLLPCSRSISRRNSLDYRHQSQFCSGREGGLQSNPLPVVGGRAARRVHICDHRGVCVVICRFGRKVFDCTQSGVEECAVRICLGPDDPVLSACGLLCDPI